MKKKKGVSIFDLYYLLEGSSSAQHKVVFSLIEPKKIIGQQKHIEP